MKSSYLLIYNPKAGRKRFLLSRTCRVLLPDLLVLCKKHALNVRAVVTKSRQDTTDVARNEGGRYKGVLVAGGDGTLHEVVNGLPFDCGPVGILPCGSVMHSVKRLGISKDIEQAVARLMQPKPERVFLGEFQGESQHGYFISSLRIGWAPKCMHMLTNESTFARKCRAALRRNSVTVTGSCGMAWVRLHGQELSAFLMDAGAEKLCLHIHEGGMLSLLRDYVRQIQEGVNGMPAIEIDSLLVQSSLPLPMTFDGISVQSNKLQIRVSSRSMLFLT